MPQLPAPLGHLPRPLPGLSGMGGGAGRRAQGLEKGRRCGRAHGGGDRAQFEARETQTEEGTNVNGFGIRLLNARTQRGMTQEQLAEAVHIHRQTIGMYENDKRLPDADILAGLVTALGCDVYWLLGIDNPYAQWERMLAQYR